MPAVFLDRLPLPSLRVYTSISVVLLSFSIYYALEMTKEPEWEQLKKNELDASHVIHPNDTFVDKLQLVFITNVAFRRFNQIVYFMVQEPLCIGPVINMAYCCLILLGKVIQKSVFGELRVSERQHLKDKFWNFVFYKFIFIFGVMNVQYMDEVILWCSWFSALGFLHLLVQLCKDRYEYLSFSPTTPTITHMRLYTLLFSILSSGFCLFVVSIFVGLQAGLNTFCFMSSECTLVCLRTFYIIVRYAIHLWDIKHEGVWEKRATYAYYSDLVFDLAGLFVDFMHHMHMLLWSNILLSMASLIICMQLRYLFNEIQRRLRRHKNYLQVATYMEMNYPEATAEEIESNSDDCAICWDRMDSAKKLLCGHLFHTSCLRSWLEQVSTCPTCRTSVVTRENDGQSQSDANHNNLAAQEDGQLLPPNRTTNHFFHFDGSRYISWFPSFSVEVSHTSLMGMRQPPPIQTSQLDSMVNHVSQMFPHMPIGLILNDLRATRSVEHTVENILEERLVAPPSSLFQNHSHREQTPPVSTSETTPDTNNSPNVRQKEPEGPSSSTASIESSSEIQPKNESTSNQGMAMRSGGDGCRFSKSSSEREQMLYWRKEELLKKARSKYMSKMLSPTPTRWPSTSNSKDSQAASSSK